MGHEVPKELLGTGIRKAYFRLWASRHMKGQTDQRKN